MAVYKRRPKLFVYPYKLTSNSARLLADKLKATMLKEDSPYKPMEGDLVVNWGNSNLPAWWKGANFLNDPIRVEKSCNKLQTLEHLRVYDIPTPEFTTNKQVAMEWGTDVVVRHLLNSHSGRGIELVPRGNDLPDAPLYTSYVKKKREFRVHVFPDGSIDVQEKLRRQGEEPQSYQIRNHHTGWIYARNIFSFPDSVASVALRATKAMCMDFAAIDVVYNEHYDKSFVLEVNSAPGLEGTTLKSYVVSIIDKYYFGDDENV